MRSWPIVPLSLMFLSLPLGTATTVEPAPCDAAADQTLAEARAHGSPLDPPEAARLVKLLRDACGAPPPRSAGLPGIFEVPVACAAAGSGVGSIRGILSIRGTNIPLREETAAGDWNPGRLEANGILMGLTATNTVGTVQIAGVAVPAATRFSMTCEDKIIDTGKCLPFVFPPKCLTVKTQLSCDAQGVGTLIAVDGVASAYVTSHLHNPACD